MARSSIVSELGFIVSFVWVRAIYCFLNQSWEPFLELPAHPYFVVLKERGSAARKLNRGRKRKLWGRGRGEKARLGFESQQAFFSRLSFCNSKSCVFNCDDLLGRSVISSPRSSKLTEAIGVFAYQTYSAFSRSAFSLHQTVHGNDWLCTEVCMRDYL